MSKLKALLLIGLAVSLAACGGPTAAPPGTAPTPAKALPPTVVKAAPPTTTAAAAPTVAAAPTAPGGLAITPAAVASPPKLDPAGMCRPVSAPKPVPNFPLTAPNDWSRGPDQAPVAMYEYSDFQ